MVVYKPVSVAILAVVLMLVMSVKAREECPPGNPLCNVWVPCNFNEIQGTYCQDCHTRILCTPIGGWVLPCRLPDHQNCVDGACTPFPSQECAAGTEFPTEATISPTEEALTPTEETSTTTDRSNTPSY